MASGMMTAVDMAAVIPDVDGTRVVVDDRRLPQVDLGDEPELADAVAALSAKIGAEVVAVRSLRGREPSAVLETAPVDGVRGAADPSTIDDESERRLAERVLDELRDPHPLRPPWAYAGWLDEMTAWIDGWVERTGPVVQVRTWSISSIVRAPTRYGYVWGKAVLPLFAAEPAATRLVAERVPGAAPEVLASDAQAGLMLTRHAGEPATDDERDDALRQIARVHVAFADDAQTLLAARIPDRRPGSLEQVFEGLCEASDVLELIGDEEVERLRGTGPDVLRACEELEAFGIPSTILHGDFHLGNVLSSGGAPVVIDWTDAAVSHPLFDLATWYGSGLDGAEVGRYVEPWRGHLDPAVLERALPAASVAGPLYHAKSYLEIRRAVEPTTRWQLEGAIPRLVGLLTGTTDLESGA